MSEALLERLKLVRAHRIEAWDFADKAMTLTDKVIERNTKLLQENKELRAKIYKLAKANKNQDLD